jgi:phosphatidylinositol alpha 1,6-mannosyltransferase
MHNPPTNRESSRRRPLRVAYFSGTMRRGQDGVTRVLYRTIDALHEQGIKSIFFSPIIPDADDSSADMRTVPSIAFPWYPDYRIALPGYKAFTADLQQFRPDILHIHSPCTLGCAAVHWGRHNNVPVVATYHTHFASYAKYYRIKALEIFGWNYMRSLYHSCQRVYVPSIPILHELATRGLEHLAFMPHGVDAAAFSPRHRSSHWRDAITPDGKKILLYAGRLVWEKDLQTLIATCAMLKAQRSDWILTLAGDGPVRGELAAAMPEAKFLGSLAGRELATAYASSDILVFPSTTETFGNVVVEAMASGIPPICAAEGGAGSSIQHGINGFITSPRDAADIARHVGVLLDDPARMLRMGKAARAYARTQTWEGIFDRLFADYRSVVAQYASARRRGRRKNAASHSGARR